MLGRDVPRESCGEELPVGGVPRLRVGCDAAAAVQVIPVVEGEEA